MRNWARCYLRRMPIERLFDIPRHQLVNYPKADAIATKENGQWRPYSTQEPTDISERLALGLMALGVAPGHKVAICSGNRSEWALRSGHPAHRRHHRAHLPHEQQGRLRVHPEACLRERVLQQQQ